MRADGGFDEDEWDVIHGRSQLSWSYNTNEPEPRWKVPLGPLLIVMSFLVLLPVIFAVPIGLSEGFRGNRRGWVVAFGSVGAVVLRFGM